MSRRPADHGKELVGSGAARDLPLASRTHSDPPPRALPIIRALDRHRARVAAPGLSALSAARPPGGAVTTFRNAYDADLPFKHRYKR
jgi:hypothetical protein